NWNEDDYKINATVTGAAATLDRSEDFVFKNVNMTLDEIKYMCNSTTENFNVTLINPFNENITYNLTLEVPNDWSFAPSSILIDANKSDEYNALFNITSSNAAAETVLINVTADYVFPNNISKQLVIDHPIEENDSMPILIALREVPSEVAQDTPFKSRIIIYNRGCASTGGDISFTDNLSAGWPPFGLNVDGVGAGSVDLPNRRISVASSDFSTIKQQEYQIIEYSILSHASQNQLGTLIYTLNWGDRNFTEKNPFSINTTRFDNEKHLSFDLVGNKTVARKRSADPDEENLYNFTITNIGDSDIPANEWNITLTIPEQCIADNHVANYDSTTRTLNWQLGSLSKEATTQFNLTLNCNTENRYSLVARGINNSLASQGFTNKTSIGCSSGTCTISQDFTFTNPNKDYEKLSNLAFYVEYNWSGQNLTIGDGLINITDDFDTEKIVWQNYSFEDINDAGWFNYSLTNDESEKFKNQGHTIKVNSFADATAGAIGGVTIQNISYDWIYGREFEDRQELFLNIETFIFIPNAPTLESPPNASTQVSTPIVLSWLPVGGATSYFVFGDTIDASTFLAEASITNYLWRDLSNAEYFWRVVATTGTQNSSSSENNQFTLDLCGEDTTFAYANNYSMSYDNESDTITVWGNNGTDYTAMGENENNPISFENIYEFGKAVRGTCAVNKPATGTYAILSRLEMGNTSDPSNVTYANSSGESIDFGKQLVINENATFIVGQLSSEGNPFSGSTLSFSGVNSTNDSQGEFFMKNESELRLYDSFVIHKQDANDSPQWQLYWNGNVRAKRSSFEKWWAIRFLGQNNSLEDIVITDVGQGFYPDTTQQGTLNTIKSRKTVEEGIFFTYGSDVNITNLEIAETNGSNIRVINYTGNAELLNPNVNFSSINWTTDENFTGQIKRIYSYDVTTTDSAGSPVGDVYVELLDIRGNTIFDLTTDSAGEVPQQLITRSLFSYGFRDGDEQGPHTLKVKKYGKNFQKVVKEFSAATVETIQIADNSFTTLDVTNASNQPEIIFTAPTKVTYNNIETETIDTNNITLDNVPIAQSEFLELFDNNTETRISTANYTINHTTGLVAFDAGFNGIVVRAVYSYGGSIQIVGNTTLSQIYDFIQANRSDVFTTDTGTIYNSFVDIILGNSSDEGNITETSARTLNFKSGYGWSAESGGGSVQNVDSTDEDYVWRGASNGTFSKRYTYDPTIKDPSGSGVENVTMELLDIFGNTVFKDLTASTGALPTKVFTLRIYESSFDDNFTAQGPHTLYVRKYGNKFINTQKVFTGKTSEEINIEDDTFITTGVTQEQALNINETAEFNSPIQISYGEESHTNFTTSGQLDKFPISDSEFFNLYRNGTKMFSGTDYTAFSCITGQITFANDESGNNITAVYGYGGNITLTNGLVGTFTIDQIYDYLKANLSNGFNTLDGTAYTSDLDLVIGNSTTAGSLGSPTASLTYTCDRDSLFGEAGGFLDLLGTTVGGALGMTSRVGDRFNPGDQVTVFATVLDADSRLVAATVSESVFYPNDTLLTSGVATAQGTGRFKFTFNLPINAEEGTYRVNLDANYLSGEVHDTVIFLVENATAALNVASSVGSFYSQGDEVNVFSITTRSDGALINATVNVTTYYPNGSYFIGDLSTEQSLGRYKFNFALPNDAPIGTYQVNVDANDSLNEAHNTLSFILSSVLDLLNLDVDVGSSYSSGEEVEVFLTTTDENGSLVSATVNVTAYDPDNAFLDGGLAIEQTTGRFNFTFTLPNPATNGTYEVRVDANDSENYVHKVATFVVSAVVEDIRQDTGSSRGSIDETIKPTLEVINETVREINRTTTQLNETLLNESNFGNFTIAQIIDEIKITRDLLGSLLNKQYDFSQEEVFLITDSVNSMNRIIELVGDGSLTPLEAQAQFSEIKGALEPLTARVVALESISGRSVKGLLGISPDAIYIVISIGAIITTITLILLKQPERRKQLLKLLLKLLKQLTKWANRRLNRKGKSKSKLKSKWKDLIRKKFIDKEKSGIKNKKEIKTFDKKKMK
ncbi:hypothetical protein J4443_00345, partial [Candidatus Woesearchaeota archaeon]|nr:hypothetical protein [Candidatus Woesearchaeota archaeon]